MNVHQQYARVKRKLDSYKMIYPKCTMAGDNILIDSVKFLAKNCTSITETGTYLGWTTMFFAQEFPGKHIYTSEVSEEYYNKAKEYLINCKNVKMFLEPSQKVIPKLIYTKSLGDNPFFFLDAHCQEFWPLEEELKIICRNLDRAIILIHDFKVPHKWRFGYDAWSGKECSFKLVNEAFTKPYKYILPTHSHKDAFKNNEPHHDLRGYIFMFYNNDVIYINFKNGFKLR